jgi:hypothetical protein
MKQITEQLQATMLEDDSTLTENEKALLVASHQAAENAYAPYSMLGRQYSSKMAKWLSAATKRTWPTLRDFVPSE